MKYTLEDIKEIMDEEVVILGDFPSGEVTGTLEEVMGDSGILFIGGKSISISDITEIYLFDDTGETYLYDPLSEQETDEVGVFSDEQFLSLQGEYVTIVKLSKDAEEILQGKVLNVDLDKQILTLENWEANPIQFNEVITIKVKDSTGVEVELAPENYLSAFNEDEQEQYAVTQFYSLIKSQVRVVIAVDDLELELRGTLEKVYPEDGGFIELKEQKGNRIAVIDILDFFVITNNGDEQFLVPLFQGGELAFSTFDMGEGIGYYSPDILQYLVNRKVKIKGDFDGINQLKGLLVEVNDALFKIDNTAKDFEIEDVSGVFVQDSKGKWDYVPPVAFEHRNTMSGTYEPKNLDWLISKKATFTIGLMQGGVVELSGHVKAINSDNFTLHLEEENTELEFPFIMDIYLIDENGLLSFIDPKTGIAEDRKLCKFSENELLSLLMRNVKLEGVFGESSFLEGLIIKCNFNKGYLIMSNAPDFPIPIIGIAKYSMRTN